MGEEKIKYIDICSLYPWTNKYCSYPIGHPTIITENFDPISPDIPPDQQPYHGLIKCCVLPPRGLLHPILPYRHGQKLLFPLCRTCAETKQSRKCEHTNEERQLWGTWVTAELYEALGKGYRVVKVAEVYHYDNFAKYMPPDEKTGLFTQYVNNFLKLKQQASGWPSWVKTEDDKDKYIASYKEHEGIKLDRDKIAKNPGLRTVAKLCLNRCLSILGV